MHPHSKSELRAHLAALAEHGTTGSILFMTVAGTSDGLLAGVVDGDLQLDYPRAGLLDFARASRFKRYCASRGLQVRSERWAKELVYRAGVGANTLAAGEAIDACFTAVYGHEGDFSVEYRPVGWLPSNRSIDTDAQQRPLSSVVPVGPRSSSRYPS